MKRQRILALVRKEWLHILRDWRSLVMAICAPVILVGLFGYALTLDVKHVPIVVWDQSDTPASRDFISQFRASPYFSVADNEVSHYREVNDALDSGQALAALILPADFGQKVTAGRRVDVQLIADGSDANTATIVLGYADALTQGYWKQLAAKQPHSQHGQVRFSTITPTIRIWYNPNLDSQFSLIPGLIAVIMMVVSTLMTTLAVAREWDRGTMYQLLSTQMLGAEFIIGKLLPYFILAMFDMFLILMVGVFVFHVPFLGNVFFIFFVSAIFCTGSLFLGLLISSFAKTQMLATQLAMLSTFIPSFLLSGFFTPISSMPTFIQILTYFVPARYYVTLVRGIFLKGVGLEVLYPEVLILVLFSIVLMLLTLRAIKQRQAT